MAEGDHEEARMQCFRVAELERRQARYNPGIVERKDGEVLAWSVPDD